MNLTDASRLARRRHVQWGLLGLALVALGAIIAFALHLDLSDIERRERDRLQVQARVIDQNLLQQLRGVSFALKTVQDEALAASGISGLRLQALADIMPGVRTLLVLDQDGVVLAANRRELVGENFSARDYFKTPRDGLDPYMLYVSPPFKTVLGVYSLNVSRAMIGPEGDFLGVVSVTLSPEYFSVLLQSVLYAPDMWASITHAEGKLLLVIPQTVNVRNQDLSRPDSLFSRHQQSGQYATIYTGIAVITGANQLVAQRTVSDITLQMNKPLIVAVARDLAVIYQPWRNRAWTIAWVYSVFTVAAILFLFFTQRKQAVFDLAVQKHEAQRRQAAYALLESALRLSKTQEIAHLGSWELDINTNRLSWSDEAYRIFGFQPQAFAATYEIFLDCVHPEDRAAVDAAYTGSIRAGAAGYEIEHRIIRKDTGEERFVHEKCEHERNAEGQIVRSIGMIKDITEHTMLQKQSVQAQKMQAIGQLTGGIAHDFNNILASILGYTDLALARFVPDKESKLALYLNEVKRASERARDLIAKMLTFSRGGQGEVQRIAVAPLIAEVVQLLHSVLPSSMEIVTEIEPDTPMISIDPVHLHQMLMNLCINARDAVDEHGRIAISLARCELAQRECDSCHQIVFGLFVELCVHDNGSGITPNTLAHMFDPFFSTKEVGKGTGMGLSTVHGLVHGYGGHIAVSSKLGEGTRICLMLPVAGSNVQTTVQAQAHEPMPPAHSGETIMVVDDELSLAHMLGETLVHHGYQVKVYGDGYAALKDFSANPSHYAALVTDYTMPALNGIELTQAMLSIRNDLPVILCSGYADRLDAASAAAHGVSRFYAKPVRSQVLLQALDELLNSEK